MKRLLVFFAFALLIPAAISAQVAGGPISGGPSTAATATALAANGANCSAGSFPLGVDASGAAESCTAAVLGSTGATDNAILAADGTGGATLQTRAITISDVSGFIVTLASTPGNALSLVATAPAATTGASQAGKAASLTASDAVASTDTAGAAAGGSVTITAGAAARNTSGNADGGDINLVTGAGTGTGTAGQVTIGNGSSDVPAVAFAEDLDSGIAWLSDGSFYAVANTSIAAIFSFKQLGGSGVSKIAGFTRALSALTSGVGSPHVLATWEYMHVLTNEGSVAKNYDTLPTATAGANFTFVVQDADGLRITAATGDTIRIAATVSSAAGYCESTTIGDTVTLVALNATEWFSVALVGVGWTCA